jgi:uncharacterized protein with GYD domain
MPTYVMFAKLTLEGQKAIRQDPGRIKDVNTEIANLGGTLVGQWALFGHYDFINVIETADEATMARIATSLAARGTVTYETRAALAIDDYVAALAQDHR